MPDDISIELGGFEAEKPEGKLEEKVERILGKEVVRPLGRGGYAEVYELRNSDGSTEAIKILRSSDEKHAARFEEETRCLAEERKLRESEHVIDILDSGVIEEGSFQGSKYYTMPVLDKTLKDVIENEELDEKEILDIMIQVCKGVYDANRIPILHRDIKPENIGFIDDKVMLTDFGIGKAISEDTVDLTMEGVMIGTPAYMSPAQARADGTLDMQTDVYSAGAVLCELVTGKPPVYAKQHEITTYNPFKKKFWSDLKKSFFPKQKEVTEEYFASTPQSIADAVKDARVPLTFLPREIKKPRIKISKKLEAIILKAIDRNPQSRYTTIKDMLDDLKAYRAEIKGRKTAHEYLAKPISFLQKRKRAWRKHPRFYSTSLGLASILAAASIIAPYVWNRDVRESLGYMEQGYTACLSEEKGLGDKEKEAREQLKTIFDSYKGDEKAQILEFLDSTEAQGKDALKERLSALERLRQNAEEYRKFSLEAAVKYPDDERFAEWSQRFDKLVDDCDWKLANTRRDYMCSLDIADETQGREFDAQKPLLARDILESKVEWWIKSGLFDEGLPDKTDENWEWVTKKGSEACPHPLILLEDAYSLTDDEKWAQYAAQVKRLVDEIPFDPTNIDSIDKELLKVLKGRYFPQDYYNPNVPELVKKLKEGGVFIENGLLAPVGKYRGLVTVENCIDLMSLWQ